MRKSLIIAIIASLVSTLVNAKPYTQRRTKAQPRSQIACTVVGCSPVPAGCVPRPGRTWSGLPSGFDVIVCPPGARPVRQTAEGRCIAGSEPQVDADGRAARYSEQTQNGRGGGARRGESSRFFGIGIKPSRWACFLAALRVRRMASAFSRVLRSDGFSYALRR